MDLLKKLDITSAQLNALFTPCSVEGETGEQVATLLRKRFALSDDGMLGEQLRERGILTQQEAAWMDERD